MPARPLATQPRLQEKPRSRLDGGENSASGKDRHRVWAEWKANSWSGSRGFESRFPLQVFPPHTTYEPRRNARPSSRPESQTL